MYFPLFVQLKGKKAVVVGGGRIALEKAEKLASFEAEVTVCAKDFLPDFYPLKFFLKRGAFDFCDLDGAAVVVCATDDPLLNRSIADECKRRKIPVNSVDDKENCTFIFPSVYVKGNVCVAVSTNGKSPAAAKYIKNKIEESLPDDIDCAVETLGALREKVKKIYPPTERRSVFEKILSLSLEGKRMEEIEKEMQL